MNQETMVHRRDGKYEERLGSIWLAEYSENNETGLWEVELFKHDVPQWHGLGFESLDEARAAVRNFYDQA